MIKTKTKKELRLKRRLRYRSRVFGEPEQPRVCIFRSNKYIYAQVIDDVKGVTVVSASSFEKNFDCNNKKNLDAAKLLGEILGKRILEKGIKKIVFDRSGYKYHGRIKAFADAMRNVGVIF